MSVLKIPSQCHDAPIGGPEDIPLISAFPSKLRIPLLDCELWLKSGTVLIPPAGYSPPCLN